MGFGGQVSLSLANTFSTSAQYFQAYASSLKFNDGTTGGASLAVTAPYISINGGGITTTGFPYPGNLSAPQDGALTLTATKALDLSSFIQLSGIAQANFISEGDIRLLPAAYAPAVGNSLIGYLLTSGNLTFEAADIYPVTDTAFFIESLPYTSNASTKITFGYPDGVAPSTTVPLSVGGALVADASTIVQNGEIQAPFGSIILGVNYTTTTLSGIFGSGVNAPSAYFLPPVNPTSVTLGAGSVTSVSGNGAIIPFGSTVDQTTWIYNPFSNNPSWGGAAQATAFTYPLTAAPQGVVTLDGDSVTIGSGATIDLDGGGTLYAQEWVQGTGGSRNLLTKCQTSYLNSAAGEKVPT